MIKEIRADITEAKTLGLHIKWMSTGRKIINALVKDTRMCFDTRAFKRGGPDPQDSILYLEQLMGIIEAGVVDESHGATDRKRAYHLEMQNSPDVAYHADAYQEYINEEWVSSERQAFRSTIMPALMHSGDPPDELPPSVEQPYDAMSAGASTALG